MSTKVYLSTKGGPVDPEDATISVFDRGFLYGDSVYETMRTVDGNPMDAGAHLDRLRASGRGIGFEIPYSDDELLAAIGETLQAAGNEESKVRVVVTRGGGPVMLDARHSVSPVLCVMVSPLALPEPEDYVRGISAVIVHIERHAKNAVHPNLKTGNYLPNIMALRAATNRRGEDAILCNEQGFVTEGATSNVFIVKDGVVSTPPIAVGLLEGITRLTILACARELDLEVFERDIRPDDVRQADEVFLTSSVRGVMPVTMVDSMTLGRGSVGPVTERLREAYEAHVRSHGSDDDS